MNFDCIREVVIEIFIYVGLDVNNDKILLDFFRILNIKVVEVEKLYINYFYIFV